MKRRTTVGLLVTLALTCWAAGPARAQSPSTTTTLFAPDVYGTYYTGPLSIEELAIMLPALSKDDICGNSGTFVMDLRPGGWSLDNHPVAGCTAWNAAIVGSWRVLRGNILAVRELRDTGCGLEEYRYVLSLVGDSLTMSVVYDPCPTRVYQFTAHPWTRVPEGAQPEFR